MSTYNALKFDGSTTYIDLGAGFGFTKATPFSLSFWVQDPGDLQFLIGKASDYVNHTAPGWAVFWAYNYIYLQLHAGSSAGVSELQTHTAFSVISGQWYHVVITYDGSSSASGVTVYINGSLQSTGNDFNSLSSGDITNAYTATIGMSPGGIHFFGAMAEIDVFGIVLTGTNVTSLYNGGDGSRSGAGISGLIGGYHLDSTGATVTDYSGNGNTGTLYGSASTVTGPIAVTTPPVANNALLFAGD